MQQRRWCWCITAWCAQNRVDERWPWSENPGCSSEKSTARMMVRELWDKKNMPRNKSGYKAIKTARQNSLHAEAGPAAVLAVRRGSGTMFHERIIGKYNLIRAAQRLPFLLFLRLLGAGPASVVHHWRWTELTDRCMNHYLNLFGRERKQQAKEDGIAETAAAHYARASLPANANAKAPAAPLLRMLKQADLVHLTGRMVEKLIYHTRNRISADVWRDSMFVRNITGNSDMRGHPFAGRINKGANMAHASQALHGPAPHRLMPNASFSVRRKTAVALRWRASASTSREHTPGAIDRRIDYKTSAQPDARQLFLNKKGREQRRKTGKFDGIRDAPAAPRSADDDNASQHNQDLPSIPLLPRLRRSAHASKSTQQACTEQSSPARRTGALSIVHLRTRESDCAVESGMKVNVKQLHLSDRPAASRGDNRPSILRYANGGTLVSSSRLSAEVRGGGARENMPALTLKKNGSFAATSAVEEKGNDRKEAVPGLAGNEYIPNTRFDAKKTDGDFAMIADRVYQIIERKITIERDRRGLL